MKTLKTQKPQISPQVKSVLESEADFKRKVNLLKEELPSLEGDPEKIKRKLLELREASNILNRKAVKGEDLKNIFFLREEINLRLQYPEIEI